MQITRYKGQPLPFTIKFNGNPLTPYGKNYDDIQEVSINFKIDLENDSDNKYLEHLKSSGGVIVDPGNNSFTFVPKPGDYRNMEKGSYKIVLAVRVTGFQEMIELSNEHSLKLIGDSQRK